MDGELSDDLWNEKWRVGRKNRVVFYDTTTGFSCFSTWEALYESKKWNQNDRFDRDAYSITVTLTGRN